MILDDLHRRAYGRILATLVRQIGNFAAAEDALQEAFTAAVEQWSTAGTPDEPIAWLTTTARRRAIDRLRRDAIAARREPDLLRVEEERSGADQALDPLRLIFTCCHPALAREAQVALTLRAVCGLTTEQIARAFVAPVPTIAQRIVRAKQKITLAGIRYEVPERGELDARVAAVLDVVYLVFNEGYAATSGDALVRDELCERAIQLARWLVELLPARADCKALLALCVLQHARRRARVDGDGALVRLEDQDRRAWDRAAIDEGRALVEAALASAPPSPLALQAAIAALHASAPTAGATDWPQIAALYSVLFALQPTAIVALNRAVAIAMADGYERGLALLDEVHLPGYHLLPAARAELLLRLGRRAEARVALREALACVSNEAERRFLEGRLRLASDE